MKKKPLWFWPNLLFFLLIAVGGCDTQNGNSTEEHTGWDDVPLPEANHQDHDAIVSTIPSPIQLIALLHETEGVYDARMLTPHGAEELVDKEFEQALIMGFYEADLGYLIMHNHAELAEEYFERLGRIGQKLGIFFYDDDMAILERSAEYLNNADSLFIILHEAFMHTDNRLTETEMHHLADLVVVGGWLEGNYLAWKTIELNNSRKLKTRIAEEKLVLEQLVHILKQHDEDPKIIDLKDQLQELTWLYDEIEISHNYKPVKTDTAEKVTKIQTTHTIEFTDEEIAMIGLKIADIRNQYIHNLP